MRDIQHPPSALVISLDFELRWGVRDHCPPDGGAYRANLLGVRTAIPRILELFAARSVAATWATVGFLFARSREELELHSPALRPTYSDLAVSPYGDVVGTDEESDPLHFAPSLIESIRRTPRQEIGTHTFSHYFCCEPGQTIDQFRADLEAARAIAAASGVSCTSIVFPRNQHNPAYDRVLLGSGITAYRGNPEAGMWTPGSRHEVDSFRTRISRLLDSYLDITGDGSIGWSEILRPNGLANVRASAFLRPCYGAYRAALDRLRLRRIGRGVRSAARNGRIYHLWWHPHNFGIRLDQNIALLRRILDEFAICQSRYGMQSLSMGEVDRLVRGRSAVAPDASVPARLP